MAHPDETFGTPPTGPSGVSDVARSTAQTRLDALTLAVKACGTFTNFPGTDAIFQVAKNFEKYLNGEDTN